MNSAKKRASSRKPVKKVTKAKAGSALAIAAQGRDPGPPGAKTKGASLFERVTGVGGQRAAGEQRAPAVKEKTVILTRAEFDKIVDVVEDLADARAVTLAAAGGGTYLPAHVVDAILDDGDHPIRAIRKWRGMTLDQLAVSVGVGKSQLSKIENQRRNGSIDVYREIADALEVPIDALVL